MVYGRGRQYQARTTDAIRFLECIRRGCGEFLRQAATSMEPEHYEWNQHALQQYLLQCHRADCSFWEELGPEHRWIW